VYDENKAQLKYYYSGKAFPWHLVYTIFRDHFKEREFCYTTIDNG
jgi:hypothetical protein